MANNAFFTAFNMETASPYLTMLASIAIITLATFYLPSMLTSVYQKLLKQLSSTPSPKSSPLLPQQQEVTKELDFPPDWYTSPTLYALENRSILSKTWLHVCHASLFTTPGSYRTFTIGDFSFILILGKDRKLRAFHNVCRHRAYTVCNKAAGTSTLLRCKYHGWTYDSTGRLVKAPKFDDQGSEVAGFRKDENGLFEIRCWTDSSGFIYINFDILGSDGLTIRVGVPMRAKLNLVESWTVDASMNWKIAMPSGSFRVASLAPTRAWSDVLEKALGSSGSLKLPAEFELSPLTKLLRSTNGDVFLTISIVPAGPESCSLSCSLYSARVDAKIETPIELIKQQVAASVFRLEAAFDEAKETGTIPDSQCQEPLLAEIKAHSKLERLMGTKVYPASRLRESSKACKIADDLVRELEDQAAPEAAPLMDDETSLDW